MRFKIIKITSLILITFFVISCGKIDSEKPNTETNNHFSILVLSDIHISNDETKDIRLRNLVDSINAGHFENLDLLIATGDLVSSFYKDRNNGDDFDNNRTAKFSSIIKELEIPYHLVLGNHDYKIDGEKDSDAPFSFEEIDTMEKLWNKFAGLEKPFYSVNHKGWKLILLNSMRGRYLERFFDDDQINFLKNELAEKKPSLIFFHHPIKSDNVPDLKKPKDLITPESEPELFKILEENQTLVKGIFEGHVHRWLKDKLFGTIPVYMTDSFADNEKSPYQLIQIDTVANIIDVTQHEFIRN